MKKKIFYLMMLLLLPVVVARTSAQDDITLNIELTTEFDFTTQVDNSVSDFTKASYDNIRSAINTAFVNLGTEQTYDTDKNLVTKVILTSANSGGSGSGGEVLWSYFDLRGLRLAFPNLTEVDMSAISLVSNKIQTPLRWDATKFIENSGANQTDGVFAYANNRNPVPPLTTVILPDNLVAIGNYAFANCKKLTDVVLPDGLAAITREAFRGCIALTIQGNDLPAGLSSLGQEAFNGCSNLVLNNLPANITVLGDVKGAFDGTKVTFSQLNVKRSGTTDGSKDYIAVNMFQGTNVSISTLPIPPAPETWKIWQISENAFRNCKNITTFTFPRYFGNGGNGRIDAKIGNYAFALSEGSQVQRTYIFEASEPPKDGIATSAFYKGSVLDPTAIVYVPNTTAVSTFKAAENCPFNEMDVRPFNLAVDVNVGTGSTVTTTYGEGIASTGGIVNVIHNENITFTFTPAYGYAIASATVGGVDKTADLADAGSGVKTLTLLDVIADTNIEIGYDQSSYFITLNPGDNGTITVTNGATQYGGASSNIYEVTPGDNVELQFAATTPGYIINKVLVDDLEVTFDNNSHTLENVNANHAITVQYLKNAFEITVNNSANGAISNDYEGDITAVTRGDNITFTFTAADGYELYRVLIDGSSVSFSGNTCSLNNISGDHIIDADFIAISIDHFYVDPVNGSDADTGAEEAPLKTIQKALDKLSANTATTIHLKENAQFIPAWNTANSGYSKYYVPDTKPINVTIEGNNATITASEVSGSSRQRAFRINNASSILRIKNLTIKETDAGSSVGGAIFFTGALLDIENCIFQKNKTKGGAAIHVRSGNLSVRNSYFSENANQANGCGGVISVGGNASGGSVLIDGCTFANNTSAYADGGSVIGTSSENNNTATNPGSSSYFISDITVSNSIFYKNGSTSGDATNAIIYLGPAQSSSASSIPATFVNNTFYGNSTGVFSIRGTKNTVKVINNVIAGNLGTSDYVFNAGTAISDGRPAIIAKNNIIVAKTPFSANVNASEFDASNIITAAGNAANVTALGLASELTIPDHGVPYLPIISATSPLKDAGISSYSGVLIPSKDITGTVRGNSGTTGDYFDIGAFEYVASSDFTWNGTTSTAWTTAANWDNNAVPTAIDNVLIPDLGASANYPTIPAGTIVKKATFEKGASADLEGSFEATESIQVDYTVAQDKWYAIGFPFAINQIYSHYFAAQAWEPTLVPDVPGNVGDYYLRSYDGSTFSPTSAGLTANAAYIIRFPYWQDGEKISFISGPVALSGSSNGLTVESNYTLVANPSLNTLNLDAADANYYVLNDVGTSFDLVSGNTNPLNAFEAAITIEKGVQGAPAHIDITGELTGFENPRVNDPAVSVRYYNLQGVEIYSPASGGVFIEKTIHQSGAVSVSKIIKK